MRESSEREGLQRESVARERERERELREREREGFARKRELRETARAEREVEGVSISLMALSIGRCRFSIA